MIVEDTKLCDSKKQLESSTLVWDRTEEIMRKDVFPNYLHETHNSIQFFNRKSRNFYCYFRQCFKLIFSTFVIENTYLVLIGRKNLNSIENTKYDVERETLDMR